MVEMDVPPASAEELRSAILDRYESLSKRLQQIARYVLDEPNAVALETLAVLAERCSVQPSAIVRFAKSFGFEGASQMQRLFRDGLLSGNAALGYGERVRQFSQNVDGKSVGDPVQVLAEFGIPLPASVPRFDPLAAATNVVGCWQLQSSWHFGPGDVGAGLPARLVLDAAPADADGRWPLSVPSTAGGGETWARGTWSFSRADMIIASIPGPQGLRRAHLSFEDVPGALRGMV